MGDNYLQKVLCNLEEIVEFIVEFHTLDISNVHL